MRELTIVAAAALLSAAGSSPALADAAAGKAKAQTTCAVCHGLDGIARVPDAPHLAGESAIYLVRQLEAFQSGERQHQQMSIIAQGLSDDDIANLADWYSSIKITAEMPE